jgi:PKD repeat protein
MTKSLFISKKLFTSALLLLALISFLPGNSQEEYDNPNLDQIPKSYLERARNTQNRASEVITINNYDNFYLGVDFAEGHISANTEAPTEYFTAFNVDDAHLTNDGHDWTNTQPTWGATVRGDPVTAYDGIGNLYYENMYGASGILGCKVARSSDNGQTWDLVTTAISGGDKNWIAADQTTGPYANYVYTTMTGNSGGNFSRSTDHGDTWENTWVAPTQSLPGMMVCVGPDGNTDGGSVYVVTNSGSSFASTYTFYVSNDGGSTFQYKSAQSFSGYVGDEVNGRNSVKNMRTRPYPMIAADNSDGPNRGRLHLVYASNDPPGEGNKPDIWSRYSDDDGQTWSTANRVNSGLFPQSSYQWQPAIWCDKETGKLYVQWMDSRDSPTNDSAAIYATYSDDGGQSFKTAQRISNEMMVINCSTCGGGGTPRYQGDYNGIVSNDNVSQLTWGDFRWGNFASFTAYFPDFGMKIFPSVKDISYKDTVWAVVPSVKLYDNEAIFTATLPNPPSGSFTIEYPFGQSITSFPDSVAIVITIDNVPEGNYILNVKGEGPNGTPVHFRESTIKVIPLPPPVADFMASETDVCLTSSIDFTDLSLNNPTSWEWTFEGGVPGTSTEQNPTGIVYPTEGSYDVTLWVNNNSGFDQLIKTKYIIVNQKPEPPAGENIAVCILDSVPPLVVEGNNVLWYNSPDLDTIIYSGNEYNTNQTEVGMYTYYTTQSNGGCASDALEITLTINPLPEVVFDTLMPVCENDAPVELTAGTPTGGIYFGAGVETGFFDPAVAGDGLHNIGYAYSDENSCADTAYRQIMVYPAPLVTLVPLGDGCINMEPFSLTGGSPEGGNYTGDGVEENMFYPGVAGPGDHEITYFWADTTGCANSATQVFTVYDLPQVNIGKDTSVCAEKTVILNATTANAASYLWTPGNLATPIITVDSAGIGLATQEFIVEVTSENGCINSDSALVGFYDCTGIDEIAGLNGFSVFPNPNNGNFTLQLVSSKSLVLALKIYNASGNLFYSKENIAVNQNFNEKIIINDAAAGVYFILLENESGKVYKKVLIK